MDGIERKREAIRSILSSRLFSEAPVQCKLLSFLAEKSLAGTASELKEYSIGVELFSKRDSYSPQSDPSVRVQTSRLRSRLEEYHRTEGSGSELVVRLPKGSFTLMFEDRVPEPSNGGGSKRDQGVRHSLSWKRVMPIAAIVALAFASIYLGLELRTAHVELKQTRPDPHVVRLWEPLLSSPRPLKIVVGMPLWMRLERGYYRHISVNAPADIPGSAAVQRLFGLAGQRPERLEYGFNGFGETVNTFLLGRFFLAARKPVTLSRSNVLSWDELRSQDVVLLGSSKSNPHLRDMPILVNYRLVRGGIEVLNRLEGEPALYQPTLNASDETVADYAIVARVPGVGGNGYITVLGAESTEGNWAAAEMVTDPRHAQLLVSRLSNHDGKLPELFELILRAEFQSTVPVKISYVRHRVISRQQAIR